MESAALVACHVRAVQILRASPNEWVSPLYMHVGKLVSHAEQYVRSLQWNSWFRKHEDCGPVWDELDKSERSFGICRHESKFHIMHGFLPAFLLRCAGYMFSLGAFLLKTGGSKSIAKERKYSISF